MLTSAAFIHYWKITYVAKIFMSGWR